MLIKKQLEVMLADAPGELAKFTQALKDEQINIEAVFGRSDIDKLFFWCQQID